MKIVFGLVGLLIVLAIVASLGRSQLAAVQAPAASAASTGGLPPPDAAATVREQSQQRQQRQQQVREQVTRALQQGADRAASQP